MAAEGNITIKVRNLAHGPAQDVSISPNATIMELQSAIINQHIVDTYPENLRLFKNSTKNNMSVDVFEPNRTIAECNIINGDEIYAIMHDVNYAPPPPVLGLSHQLTFNPAHGSWNEYIRRERRGGKRSRRNRKTRSRRNRKTRRVRRR